jgi:hypothetical protein
MSQSRINLTILIDIWCDHPRTRGMVEVKHCAFADIDEEANILLAPKRETSVEATEKEGVIRLT